jgi:hypothetical protein
LASAFHSFFGAPVSTADAVNIWIPVARNQALLEYPIARRRTTPWSRDSRSSTFCIAKSSRKLEKLPLAAEPTRLMPSVGLISPSASI